MHAMLPTIARLPQLPCSAWRAWRPLSVAMRGGFDLYFDTVLEIRVLKHLAMPTFRGSRALLAVEEILED